MDRYTLRIYDGVSHYDFPCYKADSSVYHSLLDSYPIKAVHSKKNGCDILRSVSERKTTGSIIKKMRWNANWRMQMYYFLSDDEPTLCYTGANVGTITASDPVNELLLGDDIRIKLDFENMCFDVNQHDMYSIEEKGNRLSGLYNEDSELLLIDLDRKQQIRKL